MVWNTGYGVTSMQMEMSPRRERTSKEKKPANGKVGMKPASRRRAVAFKFGCQTAACRTEFVRALGEIAAKYWTPAQRVIM